MTNGRRVNPALPTRTRGFARKLRGVMTDTERALWFRLRGGRLGGLEFRRQHPVPPYVVDFCCRDAALVVELDGSQHADDADAARNGALEHQGLEVLRFWDNQAFEHLDEILMEILRSARSRVTEPSPGASRHPLPEGEGNIRPKRSQ